MKKSDVINYFDTATDTGKALGISQVAVSKWGDIIPEKQAFKLAKLTKNKLIYNAMYYK